MFFFPGRTGKDLNPAAFSYYQFLHNLMGLVFTYNYVSGGGDQNYFRCFSLQTLCQMVFFKTRFSKKKALEGENL